MIVVTHENGLVMEVELMKAIDETNVGFLFEVAILSSSPVLRDVCVDFARHNRKLVKGGENVLFWC
jgi:hypothetical protein